VSSLVARAFRAERVLLMLGILGWLAFAYMSVYAITIGWQLTSGGVRQVDWHVFEAGARDLLARRIYEGPLDSGGLVLSTPVFNLPPLAAVWAIPLLPFPVDVGGTIWQSASAFALAVSAVMAALIAGIRRPLIVAGAFLGPFSISIVYLEGLHLATNNYVVLALVAVFVLLSMRGRDRWAGLALGLAIGTKGWPVAMLAPLIRERRWRVLGWTLATVAVQGAVFLVWLGPGFPGRLLNAATSAIPPTGLLIGPTALEGLRQVWNSGLGVAAAVLLLALPLRGRSAYGAAILAGLAPIANLWIHYGPTVLFATSLIAADAVRIGSLGKSAVQAGPSSRGPVSRDVSSSLSAKVRHRTASRKATA
jgi:Glycosyltransferase family 87